MSGGITICKLSFGTAAVFEDAEQLPPNGEFEFEGQRFKAKEILMTAGGAANPKGISVLVEGTEPVGSTHEALPFEDPRISS